MEVGGTVDVAGSVVGETGAGRGSVEVGGIITVAGVAGAAVCGTGATKGWTSAQPVVRSARISP